MQMPRWPEIASLQQLSPDEAIAFAARVAELTRAGLPLGDGLRALAEELPGRRLRNTLEALADRLDAGDDLITVLQSQSSAIPSHLGGLIVVGIKSGRLAEVLEEYVDLQRSQRELRRRVTIVLAYPFLLLVSVVGLIGFASVFVVPSFEKIFRDFGTALPTLTILAIRGAQPMTWLLLFLVGLWIAVPMLLWLSPVARWIWPVLYHVPLVGPLWRWSHLSQFASLMALLTEQKVPLVDALQITASGLTDSNLAQACRRVAAETELGRAFVDCLAARRQFPASLIPMVRWGQNASAMSEAFRAAAEWLEGRGRSQGVFLETMLVPVLFVAVMVTVGFFVIALFLPLTSLISMLSGGSGHLFL